mmetsp:Transcript_1625/g.5275  ORF Transcript_1625/g.5275 Transcript_1625/m.5275 type:complete len:260 (+) Transcript_1625:248-1027(+)
MATSSMTRPWARCSSSRATSARTSASSSSRTSSRPRTRLRRTASRAHGPRARAAMRSCACAGAPTQWRLRSARDTPHPRRALACPAGWPTTACRAWDGRHPARARAGSMAACDLCMPRGSGAQRWAWRRPGAARRLRVATATGGHGGDRVASMHVSTRRALGGGEYRARQMSADRGRQCPGGLQMVNAAHEAHARLWCGRNLSAPRTRGGVARFRRCLDDAWILRSWTSSSWMPRMAVRQPRPSEASHHTLCSLLPRES